MSLRSKNIELGAMGVVKAFAYAAVTYSIGHELFDAIGGIADPAPLTVQGSETWKAFFEDVKSIPALRIGVQFVALAYLGQDFLNTVKKKALRSDKVEVFDSPVVKNIAVGSVATLVGAQIATAALTVGPFYAPLVTDGLDAFLGSLPVTPEAQKAVLHDVESPFNLHALAVFTAYRYVRHDFVPEAVKGGISGIKAKGMELIRDRTSGLDLSALIGRTSDGEQDAGQTISQNTDFIPSPMR